MIMLSKILSKVTTIESRSSVAVQRTLTVHNEEGHRPFSAMTSHDEAILRLLKEMLTLHDYKSFVDTIIALTWQEKREMTGEGAANYLMVEKRTGRWVTLLLAEYKFLSGENILNVVQFPFYAMFEYSISRWIDYATSDVGHITKGAKTLTHYQVSLINHTTQETELFFLVHYTITRNNGNVFSRKQ